jgi:methylmalonyl-CoA mutase N-terminal domain/subunit
VVGVNRFTGEDREAEVPGAAIDLEALAARQSERLARWREGRDAAAARSTLGRLAEAAAGRENLVPLILAACRAGATVGEIADTLRGVFGEYRDAAAGR